MIKQFFTDKGSLVIVKKHMDLISRTMDTKNSGDFQVLKPDDSYQKEIWSLIALSISNSDLLVKLHKPYYLIRQIASYLTTSA